MLCGLPYELPGTQYRSVDLVELNHFVDKKTGKIVYDQCIFWYHDVEDGKYHVLDWILQDVNNATFKIRHNAAGTTATVNRESTLRGTKVVRWVVTGKLFRETYTTFDPEREDRREHGNRGNLWTSLDIRETTND